VSRNSDAPIEVQLARLLAHAHALVGVELGEVAERLDLGVPTAGAERARSKGWVGQIIERELGVESDGGSGPDFAALGIELKTVPVNERQIPRESTAICQIDPIAIAGESWETSTVRHKLDRVLFVAVQWPAAAAHGLSERRVSAVRLWSPDRRQERLLCADFELFVREYFRRGRATAITGHLGRALQVRPKGKNAADLRDGYDENGQPTRVGRMGFYLRPAFVGAILRAPQPEILDERNSSAPSAD
jgi:DNA mismatch repair protein MutH